MSLLCFRSSATFRSIVVVLLVLTIIPPARGFLPPYCFVKLPPQRTFPTLCLKEIIKPTTLLRASTDSLPTLTDSAKEESENAENVKDSDVEDQFPLLWFALRDHLPHYVVSIPAQNGSEQQLYALWRTMAREITELSGYPIDVLQEMHTRHLKKNGGSSTLSVTPGILPLLDEFQFEASGGLSGHVYGIPGVADGTRIVTNEVKDIQFTVSKGYIQTKDGAVAYELGTPLRESYSLQPSNTKIRDVSSTVVGNVAGVAKAGAVSNISFSAADEDPDTMLVRLGFATAVVLAGATAVNMLSHHLTVNVFWV